MSAKKAGKTKTAAPSKKKARFPRIEAALADRPPTDAAAAPSTAEAAPAEGMAEMTTPEPGQAAPSPEATPLEGPPEGATTTGPATGGAATPAEPTPPEPAEADGAAGPAVEAPAEVAGETPAAQSTAEPPTVEGAGTEATAEGTRADAAPPESAGTTPETATAGAETATQAGQAKKGRKPRATKAKAGAGEGTAKRLSALDAAARVLGEAGRPMGCKEMIAAMAAQGYWASPAGRTPEATLYSALLRELTTKGDQARFVKAQRGQFALRPTA